MKGWFFNFVTLTIFLLVALTGILAYTTTKEAWTFWLWVGMPVVVLRARAAHKYNKNN